MIVVHGESIDAAALPALIAGNHQGLATYRLLWSRRGTGHAGCDPAQHRDRNCDYRGAGRAAPARGLQAALADDD